MISGAPDPPRTRPNESNNNGSASDRTRGNTSNNNNTSGSNDSGGSSESTRPTSYSDRARGNNNTGGNNTGISPQADDPTNHGDIYSGGSSGSSGSNDSSGSSGSTRPTSYSDLARGNTNTFGNNTSVSPHADDPTNHGNINTGGVAVSLGDRLPGGSSRPSTPSTPKVETFWDAVRYVFSPENYLDAHRQGLDMMWDAEIETPLEHASATVATAGTVAIGTLLSPLGLLTGCPDPCPGNWSNKDPENCSNPGYNTE